MRTLAEMTEAERKERFEQLQRRLPAVWAVMQAESERSIVVVPSREVQVFSEPAAESQAYEERLLFLLLLLREPRLRLIYVTSLPIAAPIIEYYLSLLSGVIPGHARARLELVPVNDGSARPLTAKLLERPRLLERVRELIPDPELSHLVPYATTPLERDLALALGIPMYGADPRYFHYGTKSGGRELFAAAGVPHPFGFEGIRSLDDAVEGLRTLRASRPEVEEGLLKLNEGVGGKGNASVDLRDLPAHGSPDEPGALEQRVLGMALELGSFGVDAFLKHLEQHGGVVEERISGEDFRSPSVQLRVIPGGEVELLSTHDQVLGGPSGQRYVGCRFPADPGYARLISEQADKVGRMLAGQGLVGRFALDFVVVRGEDGGWRAYAIEVNLRKGGTTHPFLTLQFLTNGTYDPLTCHFTAPSGKRKHLLASDDVESPLLRTLSLDDVFDAIARHGLQFHQGRQTGVVFHMLSGVTELGRIGLTAVGDSPDEVDALFRRAEEILLEEAASGPESPTVPMPANIPA